jgi:uncharacterized protein (DUF305 family)
MIDPVVLRAEQAREQTSVDRLQPWLPAAVGLTLLAGVTLALLVWVVMHRPPGDDSVEAGFARDMMVHHDQAVAMALAIRDRTADPAVKALATDIVLTQENQIGQMLGWLTVWGLPATGKAPAMTWMGHPTSGPMPGMATPEELAHLDELSEPAADAEFLRLMIHHHQGGIAMAEAALERSANTQVRALATAIVAAQQADISAMENLLQKEPVPSAP